MIFSASKAQVLARFRPVSTKSFHFPFESSDWSSTLPAKVSKAPAAATQNAAEDPRPAPTGSSEVIITSRGCNLECEPVSHISVRHFQKTRKISAESVPFSGSGGTNPLEEGLISSCDILESHCIMRAHNRFIISEILYVGKQLYLFDGGQQHDHSPPLGSPGSGELRNHSFRS